MDSFQQQHLDFDIRRTALEAAVRMRQDNTCDSQDVLDDAAAYEAFLRGQSDQPRIDRDAA